MKRNTLISLIVAIILIIFSTFIFASGTINIKDYIKEKLPSIFSFYLSSLEDLDSYEKEFIDLLEKLPEEEQEYYAKDVYKNGFSLELLKEIKDGKKIQVPTSNPPIIPQEKPIESLPSLIKRIKPSTVIVFAYDNKGELLKLGSGFFVNQNGDIITNYHVIQGASSAEVKTSDGKVYSVTYIVAEDEQNDIIRLSVDISSKYVRPLSLSTTVPEVGEKIIVYGSPLGLENTVSDGIVSAVREIPDFGKIIQITAPISPGSSGSPVLNMNGEVIGIATFQMIEGQNLNFAIPSEKIVSLILTEKNKISIAEEFFGKDSKEKKVSSYSEASNKAEYYLGKREYAKAISYYLEMAAIEADNSAIKIWAYSRIGLCHEKLGAYTKAIEAYKQAIRIFPNFAIAYSNIGRSYGQLGLYKEAIEAYKQAIRIDPTYATPHAGLGYSYFLIGDKSSALNEYKILKELDINSANELFDLIYE